MTTTTTIGARNMTLLAGGGLALAGIGLAAGMYLGAPSASSDLAPSPAVVQAQPATTAAPSSKSERSTSARKPMGSGEYAGSGGHATPLDIQPVANVCASCGVVESVRSFQRKGEGSGLGAVAGGVVGGALGNQVGKGNGRAAMTVLGAVGGGMAGHEIEKRSKSETMYEVRVRMDDGSLRTVTQKTQPTPGSRVVVDGDKLRQAGNLDGQQAPRTIRVSAPPTGT